MTEQRKSEGEQGTTGRERSRLQQRLDEMSAAIEAMARKAGDLQAESETRLRGTLAELRAEQARLQQRLTEAQTRGTQAWRESLAEFDRRWTEVEGRIAATAREWGAEREAAMAKAGALLKTWQDTMSSYADRMAGTFKGSREEMDRVLDDLRARQRELQAEINGLGKQSIGAWGAMAKGFEGAWREIETAFRSAVDEFDRGSARKAGGGGKKKKKGKSGSADKATAKPGAKKSAAKGGAKAKGASKKPAAKNAASKSTAAKPGTAKPAAAKGGSKAKAAASRTEAKVASKSGAAKSTAAKSTAAKSTAAKSTAAKSKSPGAKSGAATSRGTKKAAAKPSSKARS